MLSSNSLGAWSVLRHMTTFNGPADVQILSTKLADQAAVHSRIAGTQQAGLFGKLLGGEQAVLPDPAREEAFSACSVPLTIVRVGRIVDAPGGAAELNFSQAGFSACRSIPTLPRLAAS